LVPDDHIAHRFRVSNDWFWLIKEFHKQNQEKMGHSQRKRHGTNWHTCSPLVLGNMGRAVMNSGFPKSSFHWICSGKNDSAEVVLRQLLLLPLQCSDANVIGNVTQRLPQMQVKLQLIVVQAGEEAPAG
jgi:hypothetical protein